MPAQLGAALSSTSRNAAAFALLCLLWGLAWAAVKLGLGVIPPLQLAAWRYLLTAALLLPFVRGGGSAFRQGRALRTVAASLLAFTGTYGPIFWGMRHVSSGLAGLVNMALVPVLLFGLAVLSGEETPRWRHAAALLVGCAGLTMLFWTRLEGADASVAGLIAIVAGTASSCIGITLSRPLLVAVGPLTLVMVQTAIGGLGLLLLASVFEPISAATLAPLATPQGYGSVIFTSVFGTIVGFTIYLLLLREWGTVRASMYAFVSPIIALTVGVVMFGETMGAPEIAGAALLMIAAAITLSRRGDAAREAVPPDTMITS